MKNTKTVLSIEQCKALLERMTKADRALFISLLLCGAQARTWTWEQALDQALDLPMAVYAALRETASDRRLTIFPYNHAGFTRAHWVQGVELKTPIFKAAAPLSRGTALTTQEVTRRMKRYARLTGLNQNHVNLRTVVNTHHWLMRTYQSAEAAGEALVQPTRVPNGATAVAWMPFAVPSARAKSTRQDTRLHGIGRRSATKQR